MWEWAGRYRHLETNIGIEPSYISTEVRKLVDDARPWVEHEAFDPDELGVRFHHRLVFIHPFPNGNGYAKAGADLLPSHEPQKQGRATSAGRRAATVMGGAFCLSSNRSGFSGQMDWGGLGWIIDPDGNVLATTSDEHPSWPSTSI